MSGSLISNDRKDILLIQEAGATDPGSNKLTDIKDVTIGQKNFKCIFQVDSKAQNKRCTTGILVEDDLYSEAVVKFDSLQINGIRRPVVYCTLQINEYPPLYIATIHATACSKISRQEIEIINNKFSNLTKKIGWEWILMGDFNVTPDILSQTGVPNNNIISPSEFTHVNINDPSKNATLDYAVVSDAFVDNLSIYCGEYSGTSDHIPVYLELTVN